ncbi:phage tail tape measure protein [Paenibacillaceae bacterium WGS1546]|uniref:phage tail tape measure protein n=1 Tax=Cohnella sp. WGS1546 TaxID=3366810 RepID=UPI00372D36C7
MSLLGNLVVSILGNTAGFEDAIRDAEKSVEKFGKSMEDVGKSMSTLVTAPLAALGAVSVKTASDFESAFAGVRKTVDATEEEFAVFRQGIRDMAKSMPQAATEIAGVAEAAGQLGIQNDAILGFTKTMVNLGVATDLTSEQAAMALARFATITQMPQENFDRLGATVVGLGNNLAATESEIVEMGLRLAGAGNIVGMTEAQILGFSGSLAAVGINAEAGGTAFSKLMINIANEVATGGKKLEGFANVAGMSAAEFQRAFKEDAAGAIVSFIEGLGEIDKAGGNVFGVLDELGLSEVRLRDALLRSAGAGDVLRESLDLATQSWEENSALTKEAEQRYATFESQLKIFWNRLKDIAITIGDALMPALLAAMEAAEPFINLLASLADRFASLDPSMQRIIIVLATLAAAIGPVLLIAGKLVSSFSALIPVFAAIVSPIGLIVTAVGALVAGLVYLYNTNETVRDALNAAWTWLSETAATVFNAIKEIVMAVFTEIQAFWATWGEEIMAFFTTVWELVSNIFSTVFTAIWEMIKSIFDGIMAFWDKWGEDIIAFFTAAFEIVKTVFSTVFEAIWTAVKFIFEEIKAFWDKWGDTIVEAFKNVFEILKTVFSAVFDVIFAVIKTVFNAIKKFWDTWGETITIAFKTVFAVVKSVFEGVWNTIKAVIETVIGVISNVIKLFLSVLKGDWKGAWDAVKGIVVSVWNGIKNIFSTIGSTMLKIGKDIIQGLINGIGSMANAVWDKAKSIAKGIGDSIKDFFGINSPSRLMKGFGENISEGLALGIERQTDLVERAAQSMADAAAVRLSNPELSAIQNRLSAPATNAVEQVANAVRGQNDEFAFESTMSNRPIMLQVFLDGKVVAERVAGPLATLMKNAERGMGTV